MLKSFWISALRNLRRHPWMALVGIIALTLALSAALMSALLARQELRYEGWIPGHERIYLAASGIASPDRPTFYLPESEGFLARLMRPRFPEIEEIARLAPADVTVRQGSTEYSEHLYWADPGVFRIFRFRAVFGDLSQALQRPDGIVITRSISTKYFSRANPVGQTLLLNGEHIARVEAVIEDPPANASLLESGIFASGTAPYSAVAKCDHDDEEDAKNGSLHLCGLTFFTLRPGANIDSVRRGEPELAQAFPGVPRGLVQPSIPLLQIDEAHLFEGWNPGAGGRLHENLAIGLLVLLAGCIVYVNLATARASSRAIEVGIRKVCGASRSVLIGQFLTESLLMAAIAGLLAVSLCELLLPRINAWLDLHLRFEYWREPMTLAGLASGLALIGVMSGAYPAFVVSRFQPVDVLRGVTRSLGGISVRQLLVTLQCAILIGLVAASLTVFEQQRFATHEAIRLQTDEVLVIHAGCADGFIEGLRRIHGVRDAACSEASLLNEQNFQHTQLPDGTLLTLNSIETDYTAFRLYGVQPIAGQLEIPSGESAQHAYRVVINDAARRALRLPSAAAAIGTALALKDGDGNWLAGSSPGDGAAAAPPPLFIVTAVVPDVTLEAALHAVRPTLYWQFKHHAEQKVTDEEAPDGIPPWAWVHVRLTGMEIPEALRQIDALWEASAAAAGRPGSTIKRFFVREYIESRYQAILQQGQIFAAFAGLAVVLASLGLLGLAAAATERRTREIGIRKALGADRRDVLILLLAQFSRPVFWASLLAWPAAGWLIHRWLQGFALHVDLSLSTFILASLLAQVLTLITVFTHAWRIASAAPISALRFQ